MQLTFELDDKEARLIEKLARERGVELLDFAREVFVIAFEEFAWNDWAEEAVERLQEDDGDTISLDDFVRNMEGAVLSEMVLDDEALATLDLVADRAGQDRRDFAEALFRRALEAAASDVKAHRHRQAKADIRAGRVVNGVDH